MTEEQQRIIDNDVMVIALRNARDMTISFLIPEQVLEVNIDDSSWDKQVCNLAGQYNELIENRIQQLIGTKEEESK